MLSPMVWWQTNDTRERLGSVQLGREVLVFAVGWGRQERQRSLPPNMLVRQSVQLAVCVSIGSGCTTVTARYSLVFCFSHQPLTLGCRTAWEEGTGKRYRVGRVLPGRLVPASCENRVGAPARITVLVILVKDHGFETPS